MEKKYSLLERFISDTPTFFKRVQAFGISLAALGAALMQVHCMPDKAITALISIGTAITAIAQFAVKQCEPDIKN